MAESLEQTILPTTALPLRRILHILLTKLMYAYISHFVRITLSMYFSLIIYTIVYEFI